MTLTLHNDQMDTITVCHRCREQLFGKEVNARVARLVQIKGWVQPRLPAFK